MSVLGVVPRIICRDNRLDVREEKKNRLISSVSGVPKAVLAAVGTAVIGGLVAYFLPGALDEIRGKNHLQVSLEDNPATIDTFAGKVSHYLIVPQGQRVSGNPGPGCEGFIPWGRNFGGVDAAETNFRVVVQGGGEQTLIGGIRARILERNQPLSGTGFQCPTQQGLHPRPVCINLDEPNPIGQQAKYGVLHKSCTGRPITLTVSENETEVFDVSAMTEDCYCKWVLELVTTQGGDQEIISVPGEGDAFETTAWPAADRPEYLWDPFDPKWRVGDQTYSADQSQLPELPTVEPGVRGGPINYY
jgi:hypothetical protein